MLGFVWIKYNQEGELECWRLLLWVLVMGWMLCGWHQWPWDRRGWARTLCQASYWGSQARVSSSSGRVLPVSLCLWLRARIYGRCYQSRSQQRRGQAPSRVWGTGSVQAVRQLPSSHQPGNIGPAPTLLKNSRIIHNIHQLGYYESIQSIQSNFKGYLI